MRQVSSVLVINPFLLNVLTLSIPKTALYDTLAKFFIFTMAIHLSILCVFSPKLCINFHFVLINLNIVMHLKSTLNILLNGN